MRSGDSLKREDIRIGLRVYDRYSDLFAGIINNEVNDGFVLVKYEWPYDPSAGPGLVKVERLMPASVVGL